MKNFNDIDWNLIFGLLFLAGTIYAIFPQREVSSIKDYLYHIFLERARNGFGVIMYPLVA